MNKKDLISKVCETMRAKNIRKPVSSPKQVFHISDDEGNTKDFIIRKTEKSVIYNADDVANIIDTCLSVIEDSLKNGEEISIQGFGSLALHKRAARRTKHPDTKEEIIISERFVPKFYFGNILRRAAKLYELSLEENKGRDEPLPFDDGGDL